MSLTYLAGPITGLEYDAANDWRAEGSEFVERLRALGIKTRSPMRGKEKFKINGPLTPYFDEGEAAVVRDLEDIRESDFILVNVLGAERVSLGTMCETGYAFALGKPVILVMEKEGNPHGHVFTDFMAHRHVYDLESAIIELVALNKQLVEPPYA